MSPSRLGKKQELIAVKINTGMIKTVLDNMGSAEDQTRSLSVSIAVARALVKSAFGIKF